MLADNFAIIRPKPSASSGSAVIWSSCCKESMASWVSSVCLGIESINICLSWSDIGALPPPIVPMLGLNISILPPPMAPILGLPSPISILPPPIVPMLGTASLNISISLFEIAPLVTPNLSLNICMACSSGWLSKPN